MASVLGSHESKQDHPVAVREEKAATSILSEESHLVTIEKVAGD